MKNFRLENLTPEAAEGLSLLAIVLAIPLLILALSIFNSMEQRRFRRWYNRNGMLNTPISPWRSIVPWHRAGGRWFRKRESEMGEKDSYGGSQADINRMYDNVGKTLKVKTGGHRYR